MNSFDEKPILDYIKKYLPFREEHILSTRDLSIKLAKHYNVDVNKASIAALCHDLGKRYKEEEIRKILLEYDKKEYPKHITSALLHARVSAIITIEEFHIKDDDIISAIESHTVGHANMSMLEKIIYASDYLEPTRKLETADKLREEIFINFDEAFLKVVLESIYFVLSKKQYLSDKTIELYNSLVIK
ncbi:bis(5'-nucleosyl)-tetraphosphatase (symmetrical) YqeK [Brachyspira pilosicoli]|uniref:bis(5'-nucleosyl)-tetraphosphatase (symmetrical) YqeK n=1 Tax=Brachyspira pilosicoli TaxID=52584 RepID=UPI001CA5C63E|nr:bis(5'-nucleosyl)-tetraphosphatase (symmetrical) YqeK [Brachyspira pilosicoli]MBW5397060.1 HD domain-containing protein [Brachyspira pilosicoli]